MSFFLNNYLIQVLKVLVVFFCILNGISGFGVKYPVNNYENQRIQYAIKNALEILEHGPKLVTDWPNQSVKLGQVSGVALDNAGRVLVFHRGSNVWDMTTFSDRDVYQKIGDPPIPNHTVMVFNDTGDLVDMWGQNLFYIPHGITVDSEGNIWLTDVALHQVFKFKPDQKQKPAMILGEKFVPGDDEQHFCKPSSVAVLSTGDFFVADGYCNHRIIKFAPDGTIILQWGRRSGESPFALNVPHALTLAEGQGQVCVADRENGRVACFRSDNGTFTQQYRSWLIGGRIFSVAYSSLNGGRLYVVNGPTGVVPVRGYVIEFTSGRLLETFAPPRGFSNPHDIAVSPDGARLYVVELSPYVVHKFIDETLSNETRVEEFRENVTMPVKPTATVEVWNGNGSGNGSGGAGRWEWWSGAAGGAGGAAAAALVVLAALALLRARNNGRKGTTRRRWEYGHGEFKLRRLLERRRFTRVHSEDSDEEPAPMLPLHPPTNA